MKDLKVLIAGAGPAGLSLASMLADERVATDITVLERSEAGDTPGWGITLRDHALSLLELGARLSPEFLDGRALLHRGDLVVDLPNPVDVRLATLSRRALVLALLGRCATRGIVPRHGVNIEDLTSSELAEYDVVVAADGAKSALRRRHADVFRPRATVGRNRYAWLGAAKAFHKLTVLVRDARDTRGSGAAGALAQGALLAWAYKYTGELSTFVVECGPAAWDALDLERRSPEQTCAALGAIFGAELEGSAVLSGPTVAWQRYEMITCDTLWHENLALVGDAAHTTHFSQGFGTMLAFDDALALAGALRDEVSVAAALRRYSEAQGPRVLEFQATAGASMAWSESLLEAAESGDDARLSALISARWPNNAVTASPLEGPR